MKLVATHPKIARRSVRPRLDTRTALEAVIPGFPNQGVGNWSQDRLILPDHSPLRATQRLVVLVPEGELDDNLLARRVWQLASAAKLKVIFLGLADRAENEAPVRRRLALLAAAVQQGEVEARASAASGKSWRQAVQEALRVGDVLVCVGEHRVRRFGLRRQQLGEALAKSFGTPVYLLGGLAVGPSPAFLELAHTLGAWSLSIAILAGFSGLQIWLSGNANPRFAPTLVCLAIIAEGITLFKTIQWMG